jgi:hypothetical protein
MYLYTYLAVVVNPINQSIIHFIRAEENVMFVDDKKVAIAYGVPVETIREWVDTNYISGTKKEDGSYEIVEKEFNFLMEMEKVRGQVLKEFLSQDPLEIHM